MKTSIAFDKKRNLHYIVRTIPKDELSKDSYTCTAEQLNSLLRVKTPSQLMEAIEKLPPLIPGDQLFGLKRVYSIDEALNGRLRYSFEMCRPNILYSEMFLDSASDLRANSAPRCRTCYL